jgi:L-alanine-DL-glutamate epimerase-like enolase superfamily enzyme
LQGRVFLHPTRPYLRLFIFAVKSIASPPTNPDFPAMRLTIVVRELHPRRAFRIARARRTAVENVYVRLEEAGIVGYGEASPNSFYSETAAGVREAILRAEDFLAKLRVEHPDDIARAWDELWPTLQPSRAAQCAVDIALWDLLARKRGVSVAELAWGQPPHAVTSFCTIGISTPEELGEKVEELAGFPAIKIKSDANADLEVVKFVREKSPGAVLAVDANCAWSGKDLGSLSRALSELKVDFIEQPLPPDQDALLHAEASVLPVVADESCVTETHVDAAATRFAGFNIKLVKCGGITPGLRMLRRGRELGRKVMVGCMLESSCLIAAGAVIAQQTDYADLDGAWLLGDDPFVGLGFTKGVMQVSGVGLGVQPIEDLFPAL